MSKKERLELELYGLYEEEKEIKEEIDIYQSNLECIRGRITELESKLYSRKYRGNL